MLQCPHCGGELAPGKLMETHQTRFQPDNTPFFTLTSNNVALKALMCLDCGRIELRGDTAKLRDLLRK